MHKAAGAAVTPDSTSNAFSTEVAVTWLWAAVQAATREGAAEPCTGVSGVRRNKWLIRLLTTMAMREWCGVCACVPLFGGLSVIV